MNRYERERESWLMTNNKYRQFVKDFSIQPDEVHRAHDNFNWEKLE